jgi:hypothetical protein
MTGSDPISSDAESEEEEQDLTVLQRDLYDIIMSLSEPPNAFVSRTLGALPTTLAKAQKAARAGEIAVLHQPAAMRSPEWLQKHGRCIDHMRPGMSTLPQAGHGAFATRDLPEGTIITTSPLHHLPNEEFVNMYHIEYEEAADRWIKNVEDGVQGYQILLNYCFSHAETSLLLCPYGAGINYINHASDGQEANVQIQWAENFPLAHRDEGMHEPVERLEWNYQPQFGFDYVAIANIQKGDELFLDYGEDWEEAWQEHVDNYQAAGDHPERYAAGAYLNEHHGTMPVRTVSETVFDPYPDHLQIRCHDLLRYTSSSDDMSSDNFVWRTKDYGYACRILDRYIEENQEWYTVQLEIQPEEDEEDEGSTSSDKGEETVTWIEKTDVPRSAIAFFDKPGHTDMHLPNAFRHAIGIPDEMIPDIWRNLQ